MKIMMKRLLSIHQYIALLYWPTAQLDIDCQSGGQIAEIFFPQPFLQILASTPKLMNIFIGNMCSMLKFKKKKNAKKW